MVKGNHFNLNTLDMVPYYILLILLQFYAISFAATPSMSTTPSLSSSHTLNTSGGVGALPTSSRSHSIAILPKPTIIISTIPGHGRPIPAEPTRTRLVPPPPPITTSEEHPRHRRSPRPITIVFEVLGGLAGLAILVCCFRCCYIYKKTPKRDRIAAVLHRHQLERELEELNRNPPLRPLRRTTTNDPVPPYFPPPPTYESLTPAPSATPHQQPQQHLGYVEVASDSPPSSPPLPSRPLNRISAEISSRP